MQFYIIHKDPETNAKLLPDYALKRVNIREGWQILSDIGHRFGVTWDCQNKHYNMYHPLTRSFSTRSQFLSFKNYYHACLKEYEKRYGKPTIWHVNYYNVPWGKIHDALSMTTEQEVINYLTTSKAKHLTEAEIKRLKNAN